MSKQLSSSSDLLFNSGLMQSIGGVSPEIKGISLPIGVRRWEIRYDELKFDKSLGKGAYGEVWAGTYPKVKWRLKFMILKAS